MIVPSVWRKISRQIFILKDSRTIVFIFIVISTTFRPIYPPAFFGCLSFSFSSDIQVQKLQQRKVQTLKWVKLLFLVGVTYLPMDYSLSLVNTLTVNITIFLTYHGLSYYYYYLCSLNRTQNSTFPKTPGLEPHHQIGLWHMQDTLWSVAEL